MNKNVETRKLLGDEESGILQVPTVKANQVTPLAPETRVKITQLESNIITPSADSSTQLDGDTIVKGDVAINPSNTVFTDRITPHPDANAPMIVTVEGQMNVAGNVEMPKLICSYIEPTLGASVHVTGDTLIEGDTEVRANKKLYVSEIRPASRNPNPIDNNITLVGNVRVQGNFRIGESNGAPDLTTMLAERPVNGATAQLIAWTPSVDIPYLFPLVTRETIGNNSKLDLKAPVKVQKSSDSTGIATLVDSGATF